MEPIETFRTVGSWSSDEWLSLLHFPDSTKISLTERGRIFVFQSPTPPAALSPLIDTSTWMRYKSTKEQIPLTIVKSLLPNDKELLVTSFMCMSIGNQKHQLSVKLPIHTKKVAFCKLLALLCLSRSVFITGGFQSDNEEKTLSFLEAFDDVFGIKLTCTENKRGFYVKITEQLVNAIVYYITRKWEASIAEIIAGIQTFPEEDILAFLTTWFTFSRVQRNEALNQQFLIEFRANEDTKSIILLLEKVKIEWSNGSITEDERIIPTYGILNTVENRAILNLEKYDGTNGSRRELIKEISLLRTNIEQKDARLEIMEKIITELSDELEFNKEKTKKAIYSKYYYEKRNQQLKQKCEELSRLKNQIEIENVKLKHEINKDQPFIDNHTPLPESESQWKAETPNTEFESIIDELNAIGASDATDDESHNIRETTTHFLKSTTRLTIEKEVIKEDKSEISEKSNLSSRDLTKDILRQLLITLAIPEAWILVVLSVSNKGLSLSEIKKILDIENSIELRRVIASLENRKIIYKTDKDPDELYFLNLAEILKIVDDKRMIITRNENPADVKHYIKTIIPR